MAFKLSNVKIAARDADLPWADNAPGIFHDETVVELETGELVAISVEAKWPDNNSGLALHGWARWLEPDGSSKLSPPDEQGRQHVVETSISTTLNPTLRERHGDQALAREVMLALLDEPQTMVPIVPDPDAPAPAVPVVVATSAADWELHPEKAPPGTVLDPGATEVPMIPWSHDGRANASIRHAIETVRQVEAGFDPAKILAA